MTAKRAVRILIAGIVAAMLLAPSAFATSHPKASLTDIENDVMCVTCRESLAVAQSPQAYEERSVIARLIAQGLDKQQIERELVAQYGPAVLGKPPAHGFNLTVYVLPAVIVAVGLALLAVLLPRWRRAAAARASAPAVAAPALSTGDARRLEEELSRFDG